MDLKALLEKLAALRKERASLFKVMTDSFKDEDVKAYESKVKEIQQVEFAVTEAQRIEKEGSLDEAAQRSIEDGKGALDDEAKTFITKIREAVAVGTAYTGIVPSTVASEIIKKRESYGKLRGRCRRMTLAGDLTIAVDADQVIAEYVGEAQPIPESDPSLDMVKFSAYKLGVLVKVSEEFIADVAVDALGWLTENIARAFAKKEDLEIIKGTGSGANHITGILTAVTANAITAASATDITLDEVKSLIAALGDYKDGAVLIMNSATKLALSLLKDNNGQYYFPPQSELKQIADLPIVTLNAVDAAAAGKRAIIAANLNYYQLVDRQGLSVKVLNELYAATDQKGIKATERVDGNVLLPDAFQVLKMKAA
ncbi:MAG: phage major capsid protein [Sphaerochaeta sp.]|nr:phage major capsid protein [Sphaerochaeta sp.]